LNFACDLGNVRIVGEVEGGRSHAWAASMKRPRWASIGPVIAGAGSSVPLSVPCTVAGNSTHAPGIEARSMTRANDASSVSTFTFTGNLPDSFSSPDALTHPSPDFVSKLSRLSRSGLNESAAVKSPGLKRPSLSSLACSCARPCG